MPKIETIFSHPAENGKECELGIDESGNLFWNGEPVVTKTKISLDWWVSIAAIVGAVSTLIMAIYAVMSFYCSK